MVVKATRKMSVILHNLKGGSPYDVGVLSETEKPPPPVTNTVLTSDLTIQPLVDGKFTAKLKMKNHIEREKNLVLRVSDEKLQIFFTNEHSIDQDAENDGVRRKQGIQNSKWFSKLNILGKSKRNSKRSGTDKMNFNKEALNENNLVPHGYISLPNYILTETLTFSLNAAGDLHIQANIKGAIKPSYTFRKRTLKLDNHSSLMKWVREHAQNISEYAQQSKNSRIRPRTMSNVEDNPTSAREGFQRPMFVRHISSPAGVNWL